jgi:group I intron endonuclease
VTLKPFGAVYIIRCISNGRIYVGSSVEPMRRFYLHKRDLLAGNHHSPILQNAWNKYGESKFTFDVVDYASAGDPLIALEQYWIDSNLPILMNCSLIAGSPLGVKRSPELRKRMSDIKKAAAATPEGKEKLAKAREKLTGRVMPDEERARRSESAKGKNRGEWTAERRASHSIALTGRKMPPATQERGQRISQAKKGKKRSVEAIAATVSSRLKFISLEVERWIELHTAGHSLRSIEVITGRSRYVISREIKART